MEIPNNKIPEKITAENIRKLRDKKGVSAMEMSIALGQNDSYINRIENGLSCPSLSSFYEICRYFDVTPCEFFMPMDMDVPIGSIREDIDSCIKKMPDEQARMLRNFKKSVTG